MRESTNPVDDEDMDMGRVGTSILKLNTLNKLKLFSNQTLFYTLLHLLVHEATFSINLKIHEEKNGLKAWLNHYSLNN